MYVHTKRVIKLECLHDNPDDSSKYRITKPSLIKGFDVAGAVT